MKPIAIVAVGAESALGSGARAYSVGAIGAVPTSAISEDPVLREAGLQKPFLARAPIPPGVPDPAVWLLERAARDVVAGLATTFSDFRDHRVACVIGTSSGGMHPLVRALRRRQLGEPLETDVARAAPYFGPLRGIWEALGVLPGECIQVLAACASAAIAIGLGARLLELGHADVVIAGGYDAVTPFVAAGFESLGATSASRPKPFQIGRDGMALGEAATLFALVAEERAGDDVIGWITGFGASCDAVHVTAPDRSGDGLGRAASRALSDAGVTAASIDLVSAHGTATPFNDAAEARALALVLGARSEEVPVHPFKAVVGHTLGASAALELASALDAMARNVVPGACIDGEVDPDARVLLLHRNESGEPRTCLKLSAAFGGANAALVASRVRGAGRSLPVRGVAVASVGEPRAANAVSTLEVEARIPAMHLSRLDPLSAAAVAATASALRSAGDLTLARTGVVVGTAAATLENDDAFDRGLREKGARGAAPRRFPATSPNLPPGQCAIAFGLGGPSLSVGADPAAAIEALIVAHDLVAAGDAEAMVVVAAEDVGNVVREVFLAAGFPVPETGAAACVLRRAEAGVSRASLSSLLHEARKAGGALSGASPGFPSFLAALSRLER